MTAFFWPWPGLETPLRLLKAGALAAMQGALEMITVRLAGIERVPTCSSPQGFAPPPRP